MRNLNENRFLLCAPELRQGALGIIDSLKCRETVIGREPTRRNNDRNNSELRPLCSQEPWQLTHCDELGCQEVGTHEQDCDARLER